MATSRPSGHLKEKSSFLCVPCGGCFDVSRRAQAAVSSSSEPGTTSLQSKSLTRLSNEGSRGTKNPSLQQSAVSIFNAGKSARPATRKPIGKPSPRSHPPQRTAAEATSSVKERAPKTSSSMPRPATSSAKQATATRKPIEKPSPRPQPPQRTAAATSSVKERASKTSSSMPRPAASSAKQATGTRNPIEEPSPYRPLPAQRTAAAATSSVKERQFKTSSSMPPLRTAAAAASSVQDRTLRTSSSMPRPATSAGKQVSVIPTLRAGRMMMTTTTTQPYVTTRKSPGSVVSQRKETPAMAAPSTAQKQPVVAGGKDEKEASVWVDKKELVSASYMETRLRDVSEINNDPVPEILEPNSPPEQASQLTSNADGSDHDRDDIDVPKDEQEPVSTSSMEGLAHGEPEAENDPILDEHEPSSPKDQASQLTSYVEGNDSGRDDIDVPKYEQGLAISTSSMEGGAHDEPEVNTDPVHEQHEPSSPPKEASQLTSNVDQTDHERDDLDVPKDELLQASKEKPVAGIVSKEQGEVEKEEADAEEDHKSPKVLGSPTGNFFPSASGETAQAKKEAQIGNEVIEETRSKLWAKQKSRVKALVGAFETVISLQDRDGQADQS